MGTYLELGGSMAAMAVEEAFAAPLLPRGPPGSMEAAAAMTGPTKLPSLSGVHLVHGGGGGGRIRSMEAATAGSGLLRYLLRFWLPKFILTRFVPVRCNEQNK